MKTVRWAAAQVLAELFAVKGSLSSHLPHFATQIADNDRNLLQELCFGVCRYHPQLTAYLARLMEKPLRAKDADIQALLLLGLYQLIHTRIPDHAAIGETVETARAFKKPWATQLINGVLRQFLRDRQQLEEDLNKSPSFRHNHPAWLEGMLMKAWPEQAESIFAANDLHPPFCLRLNTQKISRLDYLDLLRSQKIDAEATVFSEYGIRLIKACDPRDLPYFAEGWISVQDEAAQFSADLLQLSPNMQVLDACCAPGGKTGHMLEREPSLKVTALDLEERRLVRVRENLARLGVEARVIAGDAGEPTQWWDGERFDRILLDAPCSATGILRRHPDIKILRTPEDIARLAELQGRLLDSLWPLLKPNGILVYATCSALPRENTRVIEAYLKRQQEAQEIQIAADWGLAQVCGRQLLPQAGGHDGFYFCCLEKVLRV